MIEQAHLSDEELMAEYGRSGDITSFETLHRRYSKPLIKFLKRFMIGKYNKHAEDVAQVVWCYVHQYRHQFDPAYSFSNWLHMMAAKNAQHMVKKNRPVVEFAPRSQSVYLEVHPHSEESIEDVPDNASRQSEEREHLQAHVNALPPSQRRVIEDRYFNGVYQADFAAALETSRSQVQRLEKRAIDNLRRSLSETH